MAKTKMMRWWEYSCPECETDHALPDPPFPTIVTCPDCGKRWDVQKLVAAGGYVSQQSHRVPDTA